MIISVIRVILVIVILLGMVMVLLGINHYLLRPNDSWDDSDCDQLKNEIRDQDMVIGKKNLFHNFLGRDSQRSGLHRKAYGDKSL